MHVLIIILLCKLRGSNYSTKTRNCMTHHKFVQSCRQVQPLCNSHGLKHTVYVPQASLSEVLQHFFNCLQTYQVKHFQNTPNIYQDIIIYIFWNWSYNSYLFHSVLVQCIEGGVLWLWTSTCNHIDKHMQVFHEIKCLYHQAK